MPASAMAGSTRARDIYRHVWLTKTDALHLGQWESWIRPEVQGDSATFKLGTVVRNQGKDADSAKVSWKILDAGGKTVSTAESPAQSISVDGSAEFTATAKLAAPNSGRSRSQTSIPPL